MMEQYPRDKNVREDNHDHPSREGRKLENNLQETSLLSEDGTVENWDEDIDPRIIRDRYELFIHKDFHENFPAMDREEEFEDTLMKIHDGGFKRRIITDQAAWKNVILRSKRRRGWLETEDYHLEEEELNNNWDAIGPRIINFGHIGLDKKDCCVVCEIRIERKENHWIKVRDKYRNYNRAPFFKPKTTQKDFYSKALEGLTAAIGLARKLRNLAVDIRFDDGVIPGFNCRSCQLCTGVTQQSEACSP